MHAFLKSIHQIGVVKSRLFIRKTDVEVEIVLSESFIQSVDEVSSHTLTI